MSIAVGAVGGTIAALVVNMTAGLLGRDRQRRASLDRAFVETVGRALRGKTDDDFTVATIEAAYHIHCCRRDEPCRCGGPARTRCAAKKGDGMKDIDLSMVDTEQVRKDVHDALFQRRHPFMVEVRGVRLSDGDVAVLDAYAGVLSRAAGEPISVTDLIRSAVARYVGSVLDGGIAGGPAGAVMERVWAPGTQA